MPGIGIFGGNLVHKSSVLNYSPVGDTDLNLWAVGRSGFTMPATVGDPVQIFTPTFVPSATVYMYGDKTRTAEKVFDGSDYTIYLRSKQLKAITDYDWFFRFGNEQTASHRGFELYCSGQVHWLFASDGTHYFQEYPIANVGTSLLGLAYFDVLITINYATKIMSIKIYNPSGTEIGRTINHDISTFTFNANNNQNPLKFTTHASTFTFANFKKFSGIKTIAQCQDDAYVTGLQIWYPELISGADVSGNANHLNGSGWDKFDFVANVNYNQLQKYLLDFGYRIKSYLQYPTYFVPNDIAGNAIDQTLIAGWANGAKVNGNLTKHNLADSRLRMPGTLWDKSNRTRINALVEVNQYVTGVSTDYSHYNASLPNDWHISELNKITINELFTVNYKNKVFPVCLVNSHSERNTLDEILSFDTNKSGSELTSILRYAHDSEVSNTILLSRVIASGGDSVTFKLAGFVGQPPISVNWGDESVTVLAMSGSEETLTHVYSAAGTYAITIGNPASILSYHFENDSVSADVSVLNAASNAESAYFKYCGLRTGNINGWSSKIKSLLIDESDVDVYPLTSEIGGDGSHMMDLETVEIFGRNTIGIDFSNKTKLKKIYISGRSVGYGDLSNCVNLESLETAMPESGWSLIGYMTVNHIENLTKLHAICTGIIAFGDVTNHPIRYWSYNNADGLITADISGWVDCWEFGAHDGCVFTGSLVALTKLNVCDCSKQPGITQIMRFDQHDVLCDFNPLGTWVWTSAQINQLLADLVANKDVPKTNIDNAPKPQRVFRLNTGGSGAPTGQGITDKALLEAAPYNYTILTN